MNYDALIDEMEAGGGTVGGLLDAVARRSPHRPTRLAEGLRGSMGMHRPIIMEPGAPVPLHQHNFDHDIYCFIGTVHVVAYPDDDPSKARDIFMRGLDFEDLVRRAINGERVTDVLRKHLSSREWPQRLLIPAKWQHKMVPLTDALSVCVLPHRDAQGRVSEVRENEAAYE